MHHPTLRNLDLNLLMALDALLIERSVTRAAERMCISQPAMSQTLARLRRAFDDQLLVRAGRSMAPTALAQSLSAPLHAILGQLDELVRDRGDFTAETCTRTFRLACLDHFSTLHLPDLLAAVRAQAPHINITVEPLSYDRLSHALAFGTADLGVGVFRDLPAGLMQRTLHSERFMCVLRADHPALARWDLAAFVAHPHGLLSTTGRGQGIIDHDLSSLGQVRRIAVRLPHFQSAGRLAARSDLIFTVPGRLATFFATHLPVTCLAPPLALPEYDMHMRWHRRAHTDPAHRWLRDLVAAHAK